jgi:hypothetical protein
MRPGYAVHHADQRIQPLFGLPLLLGEPALFLSEQDLCCEKLLLACSHCLLPLVGAGDESVHPRGESVDPRGELCQGMLGDALPLGCLDGERGEAIERPLDAIHAVISVGHRFRTGAGLKPRAG